MVTTAFFGAVKYVLNPQGSFNSSRFVMESDHSVDQPRRREDNVKAVLKIRCKDVNLTEVYRFYVYLADLGWPVLHLRVELTGI